MSLPEEFSEYFAEALETETKEPGVDVAGIFEKMGIGFSAMQERISHIESRYGKQNSEYKEKIREIHIVIEEFVRHRTGKVPELPWLEERLNPPPMDMPPCLMVSLPDGYTAHERDQDAVVALVPFAPPLEYIQNPPENLYEKTSDRDPHRHDLALRILEEYGYDQLQNVAYENYKHPKDEKVSFSNSPYSRAMHCWIDDESNRKIFAQIHATWARDTARDGVSLMRSLHHGRDITSVFHSNSLRPDASPDDPDKGAPEHSIIFPMLGDLSYIIKEAQQKLDELLREIGDWIDNGSRHIEDYERRTAEISSLFCNIIDSCRWHIEHNNVDGQNYEDQIKTTLTDAYLGLNTVIQTCQDRFNKGRTFYKFHDLAGLIAGIKVDSMADGKYRQTANPGNSADYLDAFMAVGQDYEVNLQYGMRVLQRGRFKWDAHPGGRSLFGNFSEHHRIRQKLTTMAILYLRMPEWQAELYEDIISKQFETLEKKLTELPLERESDEPLLFVPTALDASVKHPDAYPYDIEKRQELFKAAFTNTLTHWYMMHDTHHHFFKKEDGRIEVSDVASAEHPKKDEGVEIMGMGSMNAWVDELGFVHPGTEARPATKKTGALDVFTEKAQTFIEKIGEMPSVLAESRMGKAAAESIAEILRRSREAGSVRTVATFAAMLERLLGRAPTGEETDFISLLQRLSLINAESLKINDLSQDDLQEILKRIREGKAELGDLDEGSIILLLLATSGSIPRELLVELVFKSYESAGSVLTLEAIMALENIDTKRRFKIFGKKKEKPSQILKGKAELKELIEVKRHENPEYDPILDNEWREQAEKLIKKITKLLKANKSYDVTMSSTLIAVLTAKEEEKLVARCAVDGELLTAILKFVSPELVTYYTQTYGPEENMSLPDWYDFLSRADQSGNQSHGFNQTQWKESNGETSHTVADATSGHTFILDIEESTPLEEPTAAMTYGEACQQNSPKIYHRQQRIVANCVTGGSHLLSTLAQEADEHEYAELANPDGPIVLLYIISNTTLSMDRRVKALDKFLLIQPRRLAMSTKSDHSHGQAAQDLETVIDLSRQTGRWNGAFLATNILRHAGYFTPEIREQGNNLYDLLISQLATESQVNFDKALAENQTFLVEKDLATIEQARTKYLEELAAKALEQKKKQAEIEREHRQAAMKEINQQIEITSAAVQHEAHLLSIEDHRREEGAKPTLGRVATRKKKREMGDRKAEIVNQTVALEPSHPALSPEIFETINAETGQKALIAALTGPDGKLLTGDAQAQKLQLIQTVVLKAAVDLTAKQQLLGAGAYANTELALTAHQQLEEDAFTMFGALQAGLTNNAKAIGIDILPFDPRVEMATINPQQMLQ
jgi:hypothetical protein